MQKYACFLIKRHSTGHSSFVFHIPRATITVISKLKRKLQRLSRRACATNNLVVHSQPARLISQSCNHFALPRGQTRTHVDLFRFSKRQWLSGHPTGAVEYRQLPFTCGVQESSITKGNYPFAQSERAAGRRREEFRSRLDFLYKGPTSRGCA